MTVLKSIVLLLALANAGYFLWARGIRPPATVPGTGLPATLKLTSEAPQAVAPDHPADAPAAGQP